MLENHNNDNASDTDKGADAKTTDELKAEAAQKEMDEAMNKVLPQKNKS